VRDGDRQPRRRRHRLARRPYVDPADGQILCAVSIAYLPAYAAAWRGAATLLFHRHDERLEGLAQLVLRGSIATREDGTPVFTVADDEMPHAGAPRHMLQFLAVGRGKARAYLAKRDTPWPPIPYDEIARRVAGEP